MEMVFLQAFSAANDQIRQIAALFCVLTKYRARGVATIAKYHHNCIP